MKIEENISPEHIAILDPYLGLNQWTDLLSECLLELGGEKEFNSKHYDLEKKIWADLKTNPGITKWRTLEIKSVPLKYPQHPVRSDSRKTKSSNIFCKENHLKHFISIDMKQANFQVIKLNELIDTETWSEYLTRFQVHPYFAKLKKLRLKVMTFPELCPTKQKIAWENCTLEILDRIIESKTLSETDFAVWNGDEIVFHTESDTMLDKYHKLGQFLAEQFPNVQLHCQIFQLMMLDEEKRYYVKLDPQTSKPTFKCIGSQHMIEAVKLWEERELNQII